MMLFLSFLQGEAWTSGFFLFSLWIQGGYRVLKSGKLNRKGIFFHVSHIVSPLNLTPLYKEDIKAIKPVFWDPCWIWTLSSGNSSLSPAQSYSLFSNIDFRWGSMPLAWTHWSFSRPWTSSPLSQYYCTIVVSGTSLILRAETLSPGLPWHGWTGPRAQEWGCSSRV